MLQISNQDNVPLVIGTWSRAEDLTWHFEPKITEGDKYLRLRSGTGFSDLGAMVKTKLRLEAPNISIKMFYQYPDQMGIDDGDGSSPHYITYDQEVDVFVEMRRKIEEVNLFVIVVVQTNELKTMLHRLEQRIGTCNHNGEEDGGTSAEDGYGTDDEWHTFAMSETLLTAPPVTQQPMEDAVPPPMQVNQTRGPCIRIRDAEDTIRLVSPSCWAKDKGKRNYAPFHKPEQQRLKGGWACSYPKHYQPKEVGQSSRRVQRQLFPKDQPLREGGMGTENAAPVATNVEESGSMFCSMIYWNQFQEAIQMIAWCFSCNINDLNPPPSRVLL